MNTESLPIWGIMRDVLDAVRRGENVVLTAPPGSGKTTQVPQALLDSNLCKGAIIVVQPRRVACRAVGCRVAEERETDIGDEVGYIVRYDKKTSTNSRILFVTDGVLLRFLEQDPGLSWAGCVILDEFHERRAMTDVALGLLQMAQTRRPSLRLIVMSATMETRHVARYLKAAEIVAEGGRQHPVDINYVPCQTHEDAVRAVAPRIAEIHATKMQGDILVFLAGKDEIRRVEHSLRAMRIDGLAILPLHGELPRQAQDDVFRPKDVRKIILSTNVAETSVTIPGIRIVIDTGFEKRADFDTSLGINRLSLYRISKASADQRAGRAGREAPGRCIRLWNQRSHEELVDRVPAEIQRTDLASVVLTLKSLGITDPLAFEFLDSPQSERLSTAENFLVQLGAVAQDRQLTKVGWLMLRLPIPPRYARMVVEAERSGCLKELASVAALMSGRPILLPGSERNGRKQMKVELAQDDSSDFFSLLEMFRLSYDHRESPEWAEEYGVNYDALQEAIRLRRKIMRVALKRGARQCRRAVHPTMLRRCFLSGLIDRVAVKDGVGTYRLANGTACKKSEDTVVSGGLLAAADVRLIPKRGDSNEITLIGFVTRIDSRMLQQISANLYLKIRLPMSLDASAGIMTIREEIRYLDIVIGSEEKRVEISEAVAVIAEQRRRARTNAWFRVNVLPGIGRRGKVIWNTRSFTVASDTVGPHWATIREGNLPEVILRERIVDLPGMEEESLHLPEHLRGRLGRTSHVVAKLLK